MVSLDVIGLVGIGYILVGRAIAVLIDAITCVIRGAGVHRVIRVVAITIGDGVAVIIAIAIVSGIVGTSITTVTNIIVIGIRLIGVWRGTIL